MRYARLAGALAGLIAVAAPLGAQQRQSSVGISPYVGYMSFGNLVSGPVGSGVGNGTGAVYGAQVTIPVTGSVGLYGNIAYSKPGLEVGVPILGGVSIGQGSVLMYDGGLQLSAPVSAGRRTIVPFLQAGIGQMRYDIQAISILQTQATNTAYNVGGGADIALGKGMAVRLLAKDYIGKFNFQDATGLGISGNTAQNWAFSAGLRFDF